MDDFVRKYRADYGAGLDAVVARRDYPGGIRELVRLMPDVFVVLKDDEGEGGILFPVETAVAPRPRRRGERATPGIAF